MPPEPHTGPALLKRLMTELRASRPLTTLAPLAPLLGPLMTAAPIAWEAALGATRALREGHPPADVARRLGDLSAPHARAFIERASDAAMAALQGDERFDPVAAQLHQALTALADNPRVIAALTALRDHLMRAFDRTLAALVDQAIAGQTNPLLVDTLQVIEHLTQRALTFAIEAILADQASSLKPGHGEDPADP